MRSIESLIDSSSIFPGGFFVYRADGDEELIHVNEDVLRIFGCNLDEFKKLTGYSFKGIVYFEDLNRVEESILKQIRTNPYKLDYVEYRIKRLDGEIRYVEDFGRLVETEEGKFYIVFISDITEKYKRNIKYKENVENELKYRIKYDVLTDLYNKNEFVKIVGEKLDIKNESYIVYFNINKFSLYTNIFGVSAADNLLIYLAEILINLTKTYDLVATRLYNDKFSFYVNDNLENVKIIIDTINNFAKQYTKTYDLNISFGIYKINDNSISVGSMLDYAEMAVETIKDRYDQSYAIYEDSISEVKLREQKIINNMELALKNKEFCVYFQPKYDIKCNKIVGAEALVRWIRNGKVISPAEFIPVFEHNGMITKLDLYVWEETIKYIKNRIDNNLYIVPISVNVSRLFFTLNSFIPNVISLIEKYNIPKDLLEFEITESLFSNPALIKEHVDELRRLGFKVLMDDFGSGYSGLSVLKDVDFDILKLDLKFFETCNLKSQIIVEAVILMAKKFELEVVAEGVETKEDVDILSMYGCDFAQGYYYSKPIAPAEFNILLNK